MCCFLTFMPPTRDVMQRTKPDIQLKLGSKQLELATIYPPGSA